MRRLVRTLAPAVLAAALAVPAGAADPERPDPELPNKTINDKLDQIQHDLGQLRDIKQGLEDQARRLAALEQRQRELELALRDLTARGRVSTYMPPAEALPPTGDDLARRVAALELRLRDVELLVRGQPNGTRTSFYGPNVDAAGAPATAGVRVQNRSASGVTVTLNGRSFRLMPNETRTEAVPAGTFTYQIQADGFGVIQPTQTRSVGASQTFPITVNPPAFTPVLVETVPVIGVGL
jgi:hypothetical protein